MASRRRSIRLHDFRTTRPTECVRQRLEPRRQSAAEPLGPILSCQCRLSGRPHRPGVAHGGQSVAESGHDDHRFLRIPAVPDDTILRLALAAHLARYGPVTRPRPIRPAQLPGLVPGTGLGAARREPTADRALRAMDAGSPALQAVNRLSTAFHHCRLLPDLRHMASGTWTRPKPQTARASADPRTRRHERTPVLYDRLPARPSRRIGRMHSSVDAGAVVCIRRLVNANSCRGAGRPCHTGCRPGFGGCPPGSSRIASDGGG